MESKTYKRLFFKGRIMSEDNGRIIILQKNIPNLYPKLLHSLNGIDKISILNFLPLQVKYIYRFNK
jgi:hypothetical protein